MLYYESNDSLILLNLNMRKILTALLFFISISLFSQDEKRLALVIGNANYDKGELKNPVNDARLIGSTLDSLDFDVILKENLESQTDFKRAILEFGKKRSEYDVGFVYYAGHGIQINDVNYLLPTREEFLSEDEVELFGVSVQDIMRYLRDQTDEVNILILDACRDNPFESNWNTTRSLKGGGLAKIPPPTGSLIAFSTDSGQTAPDGDGDNSVYTISLAKNMLLEDTSIDQVFRNVRAEVLAQTAGLQRPVEATQLTGQTFYLNPKSIDRFLAQIEGKFNSGEYEEIVFSLIEKKDLLIEDEFLKLLIRSYQALGRSEDAEKVLDSIVSDNDSNIKTLQTAFNYYHDKKWNKAFNISKKIYDLDSTPINKIQRDHYEYLSSKYRWLDNLSQIEYDNNKEVKELVRKTKNNYLILKNEIIKENVDDNYIKYLFYISSKMIENNYLRIEYSEVVDIFISGLNSVNKLLSLDPENPEYYYLYSEFLSSIPNMILDDEKVVNELAKYIKDIDKSTFSNDIATVYESIEINEFRDNLIQKAYEKNNQNKDYINIEYFKRATETEPRKSKYYMSEIEGENFINRLIEKQPKNKDYLKLRADFFAENEKYQLSINDYEKILSLTNISEKYEIMENVNSIAYIYQNNYNDKKSARILIEKYINLTGLDEIEYENMSDDEKVLYGEVYQSLGEILFYQNELANSMKYVDKVKLIWENKNKNFIGKTFDDFFIEENTFRDYQKKYGFWNTLQYIINLYAYTSSGKIVESYINWINSDYDESLKNHKYALFYNSALGDRAEYDYMNLVLYSNQEDNIDLYSDYLNKKINSDEDNSKKLKLYKFIFESKSLKKSDQEIINFISNKENRKLFNYIDKTKKEKENQGGGGGYKTYFVPNASCLEIINLLYSRNLHSYANEIINEVLDNIDIEKIDSLEFLYKASYIKYLNGEKFESYAILSDAKKLLNIRENPYVESNYIGYLDVALILNFDGISLIKKEDLDKLEKLIRE